MNDILLNKHDNSFTFPIILFYSTFDDVIVSLHFIVPILKGVLLSSDTQTSIYFKNDTINCIH